MSDTRVYGPYRHRRKVRFHHVDDNGNRTYETLDLYGPWPAKDMTPSRSRRPGKSRRQRGTPGWIYFVQCCGEQGPVKVGCAFDVSKRLWSMQTGNPFEIVLLGKIWISDNCEEYEAQILSRFSGQKIRGEWMSWSAELADAIADAITLETARIRETVCETLPNSGNQARHHDAETSMISSCARGDSNPHTVKY